MAKKRPKCLGVALPLAVTAALLFWIFQTVDWFSFEKAVANIEFSYIALSFAALFASMAMFALKLRMLWPYGSFWKTFCASMGASILFVIPMGGVVGTGTLIVMIKNDRSVYQASSVVLFDGLTRVFTTLFCLTIGMLFATVELPLWTHVLAISLTSAALLFVLFLLLPSRVWIVRAVAPFRRFRLGESLGKLLESLVDAAERVAKQPKRLGLQFLFGLAGELLCAAPFFLLSLPLGLRFPPQNWIWINGLARVFSTMPLSMAGLGAREGALVLMLGWLGAASGVALTLSLIYSVLNILTSCLGGLGLIAGRQKHARPLFARAKNARDSLK